MDSGLGSKTAREMTLEEKCADLRKQIERMKKYVFSLYEEKIGSKQTYSHQHSEMKANLMLAYRHLEDARMRFGKVMQHIQGGISILDKK